jgi:DNA-binding transcriptional regulator YhcF (GntR family)
MLKAFRLDWSSSLDPEEQILQQLVILQEAGLLHHEYQLPTVRELAVQLHVPPSVIENAYRRWQGSLTI